MRPYTSLNSSAARFYIGTNLSDVAAACLANRRSLDQDGLARRGEVLKMRVKAAPDAAVTRLHASTSRPDIGGTVSYDSSLLRHCACCRDQHNDANYKNILPHSQSSSFCTPDMHGLTPGNQVGFCPTTYFPTTLCQ